MLTFETMIGTCAVRWDEHGITRVYLPGDRALARRAGLSVAAERADAAPGAAAPAAPAAVRAAATAIARLLDGEPEDLTGVALSDARVEPFARRVYVATREVGPGEVTTYGELARRLGDPQAAQAVGAALGANPFPVIVPCHRVLAADGSLHGFSAPGGIATKRAMLEIEGAAGFTQQALFA